MDEINHNNNNGYGTPKKSTPGSKRKAAAYKHDDTSQLSARKKKEMRIRLSLTRPSYILGLCTKPLRSEHRRRLHYLLRKLVNQHDWVGASGVMSVYLKGTVNDTSPLKNRFKIWVLIISLSLLLFFNVLCLIFVVIDYALTLRSMDTPRIRRVWVSDTLQTLVGTLVGV
jgi:hypothetical protein